MGMTILPSAMTSAIATDTPSPVRSSGVARMPARSTSSAPASTSSSPSTRRGHVHRDSIRPSVEVVGQVGIVGEGGVVVDGLLVLVRGDQRRVLGIGEQLLRGCRSRGRGPSSRCTMRSASRIVDSRWATTSIVVSPERRPPRISASITGSTAEVASSSTSTRGRAGQRPGQRDTLALTARQRHAPLADDGVDARRAAAPRSGRHGPGRARPARRPSSTVAAHRDVVDDGRREQEALLERERRRGAQLVGVDPVDRHPADTDLAGLGVVEAHQQVGQRALARAGRADQRDDLAGLGPEGDVGQHRGRPVVERHAVHLERQRAVGQRVGAVALELGPLGGDLGRGAPRAPAGRRAASSVGVRAWCDRAALRGRVGRLGQQRVDPAHRDDRTRHRLEHEPDDAHREGQEPEQRDGLHQLAGGSPRRCRCATRRPAAARRCRGWAAGRSSAGRPPSSGPRPGGRCAAGPPRPGSARPRRPRVPAS